MEPLLLGPSGRPMFTEHEVEVNTCSDVPVTGPDGWKGSFLVRLTNFRFIFQDMAASRATSSSTETTTSNTPHRMLHWANIRSTAIGSSFLWFRNTNITLQLHGASNEAEGSNCVTLTLSSEQFDKFVRDMKVQSDRESWVRKKSEKEDKISLKFQTFSLNFIKISNLFIKNNPFTDHSQCLLLYPSYCIFIA